MPRIQNFGCWLLLRLAHLNFGAWHHHPEYQTCVQAATPLLPPRCAPLQAFHGGNVKVAAWGTTEWRQAWQALDVLVMTPDVLLHVLTHGYMQVSGVRYSPCMRAAAAPAGSGLLQRALAQVEAWCQGGSSTPSAPKSCPFTRCSCRHQCMQVKQVGLLIFDEAHHTDKGHPYAQIMEDFWAAAPPSERPHVVALTASPEVRGLE